MYMCGVCVCVYKWCVLCVCVLCMYACMYVYSEGREERDCLGTDLEDSSYCSHKETKKGPEA